MDGEDNNSDINRENASDESTGEGKGNTKEKINNEIVDRNSVKSGVAGPSYFEHLPGSITPKNVLTKTGISKSEINIRQIITTNDVTNTVALTSVSFGPNPHAVLEDKCKEEDNVTLQNFIDLKKFMASCFKFNQVENTVSAVPIVITDKSEIKYMNNVQNVTKENSIALTENSNISNVETEIAEESPVAIVACTISPTVGLLNEVGLSRAPEPKLSKAPSENSGKKKTSGNISERSDLGLTQRDSLSSIGSNVCRICMTRGRERLISPCNCKGSLASVHLSCLERWLNQVGRNHCELCGYSYPAIRTPRYTVLQALRLWFGNPRNRSHLQSDCLIFWLLSTVTAGLLAVCIVGTQYFVMEGNKIGKHEVAPRKDEGISHRITETAMNFFMAIVLCGYSVTVYLLWKDHYVMWNRWRRANVNVRLLLTPDANPVPFVPRPQYNV